jgi:hypothetical protein
VVCDYFEPVDQAKMWSKDDLIDFLRLGEGRELLREVIREELNQADST